MTIQSVQVATGRRIQYLKLGAANGEPIILVHGFLGSGNIYASMHDQLKENGMSAIAPYLYGCGTDWAQRQSVMDAGKDIAALSQQVFPGVMPRIVGCSGGVKDAVAACIALNQAGPGKVPEMFLASGQWDLGRDSFSYLSGEDQFKLNAIWGVPQQARLPLFQPIRNIGANVKQRVAHKRVAEMAGTPLAAHEVLSKLPRVDVEYLHQDPALKETLVKDATAYSYSEMIHSLNGMRNIRLDLRWLAGTKVSGAHGESDTLVDPRNLAFMKRDMLAAGVEVDFRYVPNTGHLLLKTNAKTILAKANGEKKNGGAQAAAGGGGK